MPPAQLLQAIIQEMDQFRGSHPQDDDIALMAVKIHPLVDTCP
ncbi:hypothetical protein [Desulfobulbus alkaliphilus]|nr:hypothetical protein [Desulfobulbus alkaliphilus]